MGKSKTYSYDYDAYEDGKNPETMVKDILADPEFTGLDELIIGSWGSAYEDGCQPIIDAIVRNAGQFSHITKLFVGDMDYETSHSS